MSVSIVFHTNPMPCGTVSTPLGHPGGDQPVGELVDRDVRRVRPGPDPGAVGRLEAHVRADAPAVSRAVVGMGGEREGEEVAPALPHLLLVVEAVHVGRVRP